MESLDDVIDAMIADRVIHRHRRKWLIAVGVVLVLVLVILLTGGWKQHKGRTVDTFDAPATIKAGRFEVGVSAATIIRTPKDDYSPAKARLEVALELKNVDEDERTSTRFLEENLLRWVVPGRAELVKPANVSCKNGIIGYVLVYGLPAEKCIAKFDVSPNYSGDLIEIAVLAEEYKAADTLLGATDNKYWQGETGKAVVRVQTTLQVESE